MMLTYIIEISNNNNTRKKPTDANHNTDVTDNQVR